MSVTVDPLLPDSTRQVKNAANVIGRAILDAATNGTLLDGVTLAQRADAAVKEAVESRLPRAFVLRHDLIPQGSPAIQQPHPLMTFLAALATLPYAERRSMQVALVGPAGCGKTTLAHHLGTALGRPTGVASLGPGSTQGHIEGRLLPIHEHGRFGFVDSMFVENVQKKSIILLDEADAAPSDVMLTLNHVFSNDSMHIDARKVCGASADAIIRRHEDCIILLSFNTFGRGPDDLYTGRNALDAATLDRFLLTPMSYDESREAAFMGVPCAPTKPWEPSAPEGGDVHGDLEYLVQWVHALRRAVKKHGLRRVVSSRWCERARTLRLIGCNQEECIARLLVGWTDDELALMRREGVATAQLDEMGLRVVNA